MKKLFFTCCLLFLLVSYSWGQALKEDSISHRNRNTRIVLASTGGLYAGSFFGLYHLWYKQNGLTSFRFFDDNNEWQQMDKFGHAYTAYHISRFGKKAFEWAGYSSKKSAIYGGLCGLAFLTPIEILDGFSPDYGFSWGDMGANLAGSAIYSAQEIAWGEQKILMKFSFSTSGYAPLRPSLLGENTIQQLLKDYNGQTYWFSLPLKTCFFPHRESRIPEWLAVSFGYSAKDMIYAQDVQNIAAGYAPYREYMFSLDIDLQRIETNKKGLKTLFSIVNAIKVPLPGLRYSNRNGLAVSPLLF